MDSLRNGILIHRTELLLPVDDGRDTPPAAGFYELERTWRQGALFGQGQADSVQQEATSKVM